jgi:putative NADH-flavin reductase
MKIAVIGAKGRTGRLVVKDALTRGYKVVAVAPTDGLSHPDEKLTTIRADARDADALKDALVGADAVISALGVGTSRATTDVYSTGVRKLLAMMQSNGTDNLAVISAVPAGPWAEQPMLQRRIALPLLQRIFGATYDDMHLMEAILRETSGVDWISLRRPRLVDKRPKGTTESTADHWPKRVRSPAATLPPPCPTRSRGPISTDTPHTSPTDA